MIRNTFLPFLNSSTPLMESSAGMPALRGSSAGPAVAFFGRRVADFFRFDRDIESLAFLLIPPPHLNTIFVIACTSQITGILFFKLGGPGCAPMAWDISKNNDPSICTETGGW